MPSYTLRPDADVANSGTPFPTILTFWDKLIDPTFDDDSTRITYSGLGENIFTFPSTIVPSNERITRVRLRWRYKGNQSTRSSARAGFIIGSTSLYADVRTINAFRPYTTYAEDFFTFHDDFWNKDLLARALMAHEFTSFDVPEIGQPRLTFMRAQVSTVEASTEVASIDGIVLSTLEGTVFVEDKYDSTIRHRIVNHIAVHLIRSDDTLLTEVGSPFFLHPTYGDKVTRVGTPFYHSVIHSKRSGKWNTIHQGWLLDSAVGTFNLKLSDITVIDASTFR